MKSPPPEWMKASIQCLILIRHACSLTSKPLLKGNYNSCPYHSDLHLLCYVPFLLIPVMHDCFAKIFFGHLLYSIKARRQTDLES
jgi:hypothetical protein